MAVGRLEASILIGSERLKLKSKDGKAKKGKGKIKIEFDRVKGDFDSFLKDTHKAGYDEGGDGDDFI